MSLSQQSWGGWCQKVDSVLLVTTWYMGARNCDWRSVDQGMGMEGRGGVEEGRGGGCRLGEVGLEELGHAEGPHVV
jgi:hypothetical protein